MPWDPTLFISATDRIDKNLDTLSEIEYLSIYTL